ncbi:MAG: MBL fold metallo-hydrolase [bacterium]
MHKFVVRGVRGSIPVSSRSVLRHGGNTTCFSLQTDKGFIVFDTGTGIASLSRELAGFAEPPPVTVLFTHFHLDHVIGLPSFAPIYNPRAWISFMADPNRKDDWRTTLRTLFSAPYWPGGLIESGAAKCFECLPSDRNSIEIYGTRISWCPVSHPQGCLSYKVECGDQVVVIATDHEHSDNASGFLEFCHGADVLVYDAMYTPEEYATRVGWGHGNWQQGVQIAIEAGIHELVLTHHAAERSDVEVDEIVRQSRAFFPRTRAATENMVLCSSS